MNSILMTLVFIFSAFITLGTKSSMANSNVWELPKVTVSPSDPYKIDTYKVSDPVKRAPVASASSYSMPSNTYRSPAPAAMNQSTYQMKSSGKAYSTAPRYMAIHAGTFFNEEAHQWGEYDYESPGKLNLGVTYRIGEWINSMDLLMRIDYTKFEVQNEGLSKVSLLPLIMFPDARSGFPIYFGAGLGAGFFLEQLSGESHVSLDYQLIGGLRFLDVYKTLGFFLESGVKGQLQVLKDGEHRGMFLSAGTVFNF